MFDSFGFSEISTNTLLKLSEIASSDKAWKDALDDLFVFSRKQFIVDNLAVYLSDITTNRLEVIYARGFGRGRSAEADVSWGESISSRVTNEKKIICERSKITLSENRLAEPFILGIPLCPYKNISGALVFIRFGGPDFSDAGIKYANFLAQEVNSILSKKVIFEYSQKHENQVSLTKLQENFINTISHELRSPLGFIKGYTTTLLREDMQWDSTTQNDFLRIIERETNHLQELIDNLLDSSSLQSGQMRFDSQLVRLDSLIRDEVNRALINHPNLVFHFQFDEQILPILGDPNRLAQVIDNLINNSIKYAPGAEIFITIHQTASQVIIDYRDTGKGISEGLLPKLFTRFFRDPDQSIKVHGSGLGLSICKEIIERHSGEISASVPDGFGLAFSIRLPATLNIENISSGEENNDH